MAPLLESDQIEIIPFDRESWKGIMEVVEYFRKAQRDCMISSLLTGEMIGNEHGKTIARIRDHRR